MNVRAAVWLKNALSSIATLALTVALAVPYVIGALVGLIVVLVTYTAKAAREGYDVWKDE